MDEPAKAFAFGPFRLLPDRRTLAAEGRELPIRGRAFDLLLALVERRDRVVTKDEIMELVWPGRVVEEGNLTVHIAGLRKLLGSGIIATLSGRGYRFVAPVTEVPAGGAPASPSPQPAAPAQAAGPVPTEAWPGELPRPLTKLIGRDEDLERVAARLGESQLVTIVGAGGVGKTRLALAVADRIRPSCPDGAWFADLGPVEEARLVPAAITSVLGVDVGGGDALRVAVAALANRRGLLVLDCCEHLLQAAAETAEAILRNCPGVIILATSREPLRAEGERLHRLQPLEAPAPDATMTAARLTEHPASELFLERARAALGEFTPSDADATEIMRICQRLDGIPLAIELAAPALQAMTLAELRQRLERHFELLASGRRTALARHQTLRATTSWSLDLLEPRERALLLRLSVFNGTWTASAAADLLRCGASEDEVCGVIASLVDKSLVQADLTGLQARYRLLDSTRYYAAERLPATEAAEARRNMAGWLLGAYARAEADWPFMPDDDWFALYAPEMENLRAALSWAFGPEGDERLGVALASLTEHVWAELSLTGELHSWFTLAISRIDGATPPDVAGRLWLGRCGWVAQRGRPAQEAAQRAASLLRPAGNPLDIGRALWRWGWHLVLTDQLAAADPLLAEAEALLRSEKPNKALISCLRARAIYHLLLGEFDLPRAILTEALTLARQLRSPRDIALTLGTTAEMHCAAGRLAEAITVARESMATLEPARARSSWVQYIAGAEASYRLAQGDIGRARPIVAERLTASRLMRLPHEVTANLERVALIAALEGHVATAARLHGYAQAYYTERGLLRTFGARAVLDRLMPLLRQRLVPEELVRLAAQGAALDEDAMAEEALAILSGS